MVQTFRCNSKEYDFILLTNSLDEDLKTGNGEKQSFYQQFNKIINIDTVVLLKFNNKSVGCGCFKEYDNSTVEIKRMYISPEYRGKGYSKVILGELENWAKELGYQRAILETGTQNTKAITLYQSFGYKPTENYGQYSKVDSSACFEKLLQ